MQKLFNFSYNGKRKSLTVKQALKFLQSEV